MLAICRCNQIISHTTFFQPIDVKFKTTSIYMQLHMQTSCMHHQSHASNLFCSDCLLACQASSILGVQNLQSPPIGREYRLHQKIVMGGSQRWEIAYHTDIFEHWFSEIMTFRFRDKFRVTFRSETGLKLEVERVCQRFVILSPFTNKPGRSEDPFLLSFLDHRSYRFGDLWYLIAILWT